MRNDVCIASLEVVAESVVSLSGLQIYNAEKVGCIKATPDAHPATRMNVTKIGDDKPIDFVLNHDSGSTGASQYLLKLCNDDDLLFNFRFVIRQNAGTDTNLEGLTFINAKDLKELGRLLNREFKSDPNLQKRSNVKCLGDYSTSGKTAMEFEWTWKYESPMSADRSKCYGNACCIAEYDKREDRLMPLITFSYWIQDENRLSLTVPTSPLIEGRPSLRLQPPLAYSSLIEEPVTPVAETTDIFSPHTIEAETINLNFQSLAELEPEDDGPLFRATINNLERKTSVLRHNMKKIIKRAAGVNESRLQYNAANFALNEALRDAASSNGSGNIRIAFDKYFTMAQRQFQQYDVTAVDQLQSLLIEPLRRLYENDIKKAEAKKRDFEEESKDYYQFLARYLSIKNDAVKTTKTLQSDSKYQTKRKNFELKRFDYFNFMQDLHGGRKEQELVQQLVLYAVEHSASFLATAKELAGLKPNLEGLATSVREADKDLSLQRIEREERRRTLEVAGRLENVRSEESLGGNDFKYDPNDMKNGPPTPQTATDRKAQTTTPPSANLFKGVRDLEEREAMTENGRKKEGLLWASSRPNNHNEPISLPPKLSWHKYWVVLAGGQLAEYENWKKSVVMHNDPINLRMASVREARSSDRRFCFEVLTPQSKRIYQTTNDEDMTSWIQSISNAISSTLEESSLSKSERSGEEDDNVGMAGAFHHQPPLQRRITISGSRTPSKSEDPTPQRLIERVRETHPSNAICADCGSTSKTEWVSINLQVILCIECSGLHRSLGTHISKIRSLTLDSTSFSSDLLDLVLQISNSISNSIWEQELSINVKPSPSASRETRLRYITSKYSSRVFIGELEKSPDDVLIAGVRGGNIATVVSALAHRANPNINMNLEPIVITALRDESTTFGMAELLFQFGALVPDYEGLGLSEAAKSYLALKRTKEISASTDGRATFSRLQKRMSAGGKLMRTPLIKE